ncbi:MAG: phage major capsid protein [Vicinamibacterales bacterium]
MDRLFKALPFLTAFFIAVAAMPTNVVQVNAKQMGTEHAQPYRAKALMGLDRLVGAARSRISSIVESLAGHPLRGPALAGVAMLVAAVIAPEHVGMSGMLMGSLSLARNKAATLEADRRKLVKERADLGAKALTEDRAMTAKEKEDFAELGTKITAAEAAIDDHKAILAAAEAQAAIDRDPVQTPAVAQDLPSVQPGADRSLDPKQPGFFGRQLQAVRNAALAVKGGEGLSAQDRALLKPMAAATGANSDVPAEGGYLVGQERSSTVLQRAYSTGAILSRVSRQPIGAASNGMKFPAIDETSRADNSRFGGIVSGWLGQGNTLTSGKPKFREMDMKLRKVGAFVYATDEMLQDAIALDGWVNKNLPLELTFRTEDAIVNGTGANQPQGLLANGAVISVTRNTASRVVYEDISGMWARLWAGARGIAGDASKTVWLVDQSVEPQLEQIHIALGTAGVLAPIYKPAGSVPGQAYASLYGRPVIPVEYCAALGTSGDIVLTALDEYTVIDKGGVEQAVSIHVAFLTDEQVFRFIYRVDGQGNWNSALTPKSGGDTLSPIIKLS